MQAAHDYMHLGEKGWDHVEFPGVVKRSSIGSLVLGGLSFAVQQALALAAIDEDIGLYLVRITLWLWSWLSFVFLSEAIQLSFSPSLSRVFRILLYSQFHIPFYMSRTLPNTFALIFSNLALANYLKNQNELCVFCIAVAGVIFRCDMVLLAIPIGMLMLLQSRVTGRVIGSVIVSGMVWVMLTVAVDSIFWGEWTWPELDVLRFNTVENRSSEWGVFPWHWYWTRAIPRVMTSQLILVPFGLLACWRQPILKSCVFMILFYVGLYSLLPHKEVRFLFPVFPLITILAAKGAENLMSNWKRLGGLLVTGWIAASFAVALLSVLVSGMNYPGAEAINWLNRNMAPGIVHIDVYPAQTGITRFLQDDRFQYSKLEEPNQNWSQFDYLITDKQEMDDFEVIKRITGFERIDFSNLSIVQSEVLRIFKNIKK